MKSLVCICCLAALCSCSSAPKQMEEMPEAVSGLAPQAEAPPEKHVPHITLYVNADGSLLLDKQPAGLAEVEKRLLQLKSEGGTVFYSRDNQQQDPPEIAIQAMDLVAKQGLPVQFYTDKTFTQAVSFQ